MNDIDKAQTIIEAEEIARQYEARMSVGLSLMFCSDCGQKIPEARRSAYPGVRTCLICQEFREQTNMENF